MEADSLRITHVVRAKPPGELGGAESHVFDLALSQLAAGHHVRVVLLGPAHIATAVETDVPTVRLDSMSMVTWLRGLRAEIRDNPPHVLHSHGYRADLIARCMRRVRGRECSRAAAVVTVHGFIRITPALRLLTRLNERILRSAHVVISVSSAEAERLTRLLRKPVYFVPNGVRRVEQVPRCAARAAIGSDPARQAVGFIGRLSPEKRPDLFIDMAVLVAAQLDDVDFVVIGSGPMRDHLDRRAARTGARIIFTGLIPNAGSLVSALDVVVCPSDCEGTPRSVIESMLAGVPVVATRVGGLPDLLSDGASGVLVEPGSAPALARAVLCLLRAPAAARAISEEARADAAERFSATRMAERVLDAYRTQLAVGSAESPQLV
jgi:L-malate glycosyltransferase